MTIKKPKNYFQPGRLSLYDKLIETNPAIERKGASMPYTSLNGHMFSFLSKDGSLALRLPTSERDDFIKKYTTKLCEANGTILKEYVVVPTPLFENTDELKKYFDASFQYVKSLKPKVPKGKITGK